MFNFVQDQGRRSRHVGINHPAEIQRDRHPHTEYFEDLSASGGLKFESVDKSRSAGTQILGKRGRFEIGSAVLTKITIISLFR